MYGSRGNITQHLPNYVIRSQHLVDVSTLNSVPSQPSPQQRPLPSPHANSMYGAAANGSVYEVSHLWDTHEEYSNGQRVGFYQMSQLIIHLGSILTPTPPPPPPPTILL